MIVAHHLCITNSENHLQCLINPLSVVGNNALNGLNLTTRRSLSLDDAQGLVRFRARIAARGDVPCALSRGNASRGKDRRVIGPRPCLVAA